MRRIVITLALAFLAAYPTQASAQSAATPRTEVLAVVHQFADSFNKGDTKATVAACADEASVIDEFPPHEWHGAGACAKWMDDYDADAKKNGITDGIVTLGKATHVDVTADRAYVVISANYVFKKNGKPVQEIGSMLTVALQKGPTGWRITGWSWTKH
jgi:ketosteroid isomerase-like protein